MIITSDRKVRISRGETLNVNSSTATLNWLGKEVPANRDLSIAPASGRGMLRLHATSDSIGELTVKSSTGQEWSTTIFPGTTLVEFIVEPEPDEWYCENDDGNPPHPVSKGDSKCWFCGGKVVRGGR